MAAPRGGRLAAGRDHRIAGDRRLDDPAGPRRAALRLRDSQATLPGETVCGQLGDGRAQEAFSVANGRSGRTRRPSAAVVADIVALDPGGRREGDLTDDGVDAEHDRSGARARRSGSGCSTRAVTTATAASASPCGPAVAGARRRHAALLDTTRAPTKVGRLVRRPSAADALAAAARAARRRARARPSRTGRDQRAEGYLHPSVGRPRRGSSGAWLATEVVGDGGDHRSVGRAAAGSPSSVPQPVRFPARGRSTASTTVDGQVFHRAQSPEARRRGRATTRHTYGGFYGAYAMGEPRTAPSSSRGDRTSVSAC